MLLFSGALSRQQTADSRQRLDASCFPLSAISANFSVVGYHIISVGAADNSSYNHPLLLPAPVSRRAFPNHNHNQEPKTTTRIRTESRFRIRTLLFSTYFHKQKQPEEPTLSYTSPAVTLPLRCCLRGAVSLWTAHSPIFIIPPS